MAVLSFRAGLYPLKFSSGPARALIFQTFPDRPPHLGLRRWAHPTALQSSGPQSSPAPGAAWAQWPDQGQPEERNMVCEMKAL